jgi:hypothetical protein
MIMWRRLELRSSGEPLSNRMGLSQVGQMGGLNDGAEGSPDRMLGMGHIGQRVRDRLRNERVDHLLASPLDISGARARVG